MAKSYRGSANYASPCSFGNVRFMVIFLEITEKECVRGILQSEAKIRLVQYCAAVSAIAELLLLIHIILSIILSLV